MCIECRQIRCHPLCPNNTDDPKAVFVCSGCGEDIYEGDYYYDVLGEQFCEECMFEYKKEAVYEAG